MNLAFTPANGDVVINPSLNIIYDALGLSYHEYWGNGENDIALYADERPLVDATGGLMIGRGVRQLAILRKEPLGFHIQYVIMFDEPVVAISSDDFSETVPVAIGGEPSVLPKAFFVPLSLAKEAVAEFYRSGIPGPTLKWMKLHEQEWAGTDE